MAQYLAAIHKDKESDYGVSFPDFPGCVTAGSTLGEVLLMASEVLQFHIDGMVEDGEEVPDPISGDEDISLEAIRRKYKAQSLALVEVPGASARRLRVNVMLPEDLLSRIDKVSTNRSKFLEDAARLEILRIKETASRARPIR